MNGMIPQPVPKSQTKSFRLGEAKFANKKASVPNLCSGVTPVSYTHLDVYKRQRWFYMMVLMMSLATVIVLENKKMDISFGIKTTFIITCLFAIIGIIPTTEDGKTTYFSAPGCPTMFWINVLIAILCIVIAAFILQKYRKSKTRLYRSSLIALCAIIVVNGVVQVSWGKMQNVDYVYRNVVDRGLNAEFQLDDSEFYRIDVYDGMDNWPMYWLSLIHIYNITCSLRLF